MKEKYPGGLEHDPLNLESEGSKIWPVNAQAKNTSRRTSVPKSLLVKVNRCPITGPQGGKYVCS